MPMSTRTSKAAFCRFLDQAVNNGNLAVVDDIVHPDFTGYFPDAVDPKQGPEGCRRWVADLRSGFSDLNALIEGGWLVGEVGTHEVGKGTRVERVAVWVVLRGTHTGDFAGVAATGKPVIWSQVHLLTFVDDRIIQDVVVNDTLSQLRQMNVGALSETTAPALIPPELI
jgi:hypothetical protein